MDDGVARFRNLVPDAGEVTEGLRHGEAGLVGQLVQYWVVRVLGTERGDVGAAEERPGAALARVAMLIALLTAALLGGGNTPFFPKETKAAIKEVVVDPVRQKAVLAEIKEVSLFEVQAPINSAC